MKIALIAHDKKKPEMIEKSKFYALLMVTAVLAAVIVFLICYMFL